MRRALSINKMVSIHDQKQKNKSDRVYSPIVGIRSFLGLFEGIPQISSFPRPFCESRLFQVWQRDLEQNRGFFWDIICRIFLLYKLFYSLPNRFSIVLISGMQLSAEPPVLSSLVWIMPSDDSKVYNGKRVDYSGYLTKRSMVRCHWSERGCMFRFP